MLIEYLSDLTTWASSSSPLVIDGVAVVVLFLLAWASARHTIVYKRNNEGVFFAILLASGGFVVLGYLGLLAFGAGVATAACVWIKGIRDANNGLFAGRRISDRPCSEHYARQVAMRERNLASQFEPLRSRSDFVGEPFRMRCCSVLPSIRQSLRR